MKKIKKSGIILITTILFMAIMTMMSLVIVQNGIESLSGGKSYADNEQAYMAALSGVELVKAELYEDRNFGLHAPTISSSNGQDIIIESTKDFVTGYIKLNSETNLSNEEYDSRFDIVFKEPSDSTGLPKKLPKELKDRCQYASVNNLWTSTEILKEKDSDYRRDVAKESFYLVVRGTCGKRVKYIETVFTSDGPSALNQGSNAFNDIKVNGTIRNKILNDPVLTISNKNSSKSGKIIAGNNFKLTGTTDNLEDLLYTKKPVTISSTTANIGDKSKDNDRLELESNNITLDNNIPNEAQISSIDTIEKAMKNANISDSSFKSKLASGTYVFVRAKNRNSGQSEWRFYQNIIDDNQDINSFMSDSNNNYSHVYNKDGISFKENINNVSINKNTKISKILGTQYRDVRRVTVTDNVYSDGAVKFMVVDKKTNENNITRYNKSNLSVDFSIKNGAIKTSGDLTINGEVTGSGKILSNGNLTMNSGSVMETKPQSGVAIWANGDVNIKEAKNLSFDADRSTIDQLLADGYKSAFKKGVTVSNGDEIEIGNNIYTVEDTIDQAMEDIGQDSVHKDEKAYNFRLENKNNNNKTYDIAIGLKDSKVNIYKNENLLYSISKSQIQKIILNSKNVTIDNTKINIKRHTGTWYTGDYELKVNGEKIGIIDLKHGHLLPGRKKYPSDGTIENDSMLFSTHLHNGTLFTNKKIAEAKGTGEKFGWQSDYSDDEEDYEITATTLEGYLEEYAENKISSTEIKGTVYSNRNIKINGSKNSFNILGALIAKNNIKIDNILSSELKYDPDYVPFFQNYGIITNLVFQSVFNHHETK